MDRVYPLRCGLFLILLWAKVVCGFVLQNNPPCQASLRLQATTADTTSRGTPFNFGPATLRSDNCLYTAERPGNPPGKTDPISLQDVEEWIAYIQKQGITRVTVLLDENELNNYLPHDLLQLYTQSGLECERLGMSSPQAARRMMARLQETCDMNEKMVVHCTGGVGRCGRVAAAWLVHRYDLTYEEATAETLATAQTYGVKRKGDASMLHEWYEQI